MLPRIPALLERYRSDVDFREAVDDMTAAVGLLLPKTPLSAAIDDVVLLARFKREQARARALSSGVPTQQAAADSLR